MCCSNFFTSIFIARLSLPIKYLLLISYHFRQSILNYFLSFYKKIVKLSSFVY
ncbi:hypothetical protein FM106_11495 [Brachybacterium faecium]|nr:hypothetical protein FM106_11495 [Brachybacterium faecium]